MAESIMVDSHVWVEDPEIAWIDGVVLNIKGDEAEVKTNDGREVKDLFSFLLQLSTSLRIRHSMIVMLEKWSRDYAAIFPAL